MRGLSTRNYGAVVKDFQSAYGIEKSAVSENFIEASREKVKQLMERHLSELVERGLDFSMPRLYILDGGKALHAACDATPARLRSSNAARSTRNAMSWITCRTNTKPTSKENSRTPTRWRTTPTPSVLWTVCIAS